MAAIPQVTLSGLAASRRLQPTGSRPLIRLTRISNGAAGEAPLIAGNCPFPAKARVQLPDAAGRARMLGCPLSAGVPASSV